MAQARPAASKRAERNPPYFPAKDTEKTAEREKREREKRERREKRKRKRKRKRERENGEERERENEEIPPSHPQTNIPAGR